MKAGEASLLKILENRMQFVVPIYQRTYSWTRKQCGQLWDDIVRVGTEKDYVSHFIGSIVYVKEEESLSQKCPQVLLIDGQQRIATVILLLGALAEVLEDAGPRDTVNAEMIRDLYLFNKHTNAERRYKLILTRSDKDTLIRLLEGIQLAKPVSKLIEDSYGFFLNKIRSSEVDLDRLCDGIQKLILVDIVLNREHDNAQLIFESLNSTGLELSQADLIRNYILMGQEPTQQKKLYQHYWFPIEQAFRHAEYTDEFDDFVRHWLTIKLGRIPIQNRVYEEFKAFTRFSKPDEVEALVADIRRYSDYYANMAFDAEKDRELQQIFRDIQTLKVNVAYPLLLELYDDYAEGRLSKENFAEMLRLIESYVFRRSICGIPTNSLNKTFAGLLKEIDRGNCVESLRAALQLKDGYRRFPSDAEFSEAFLTKDCYNLRNRNYLLRKLENHGRKELVDVSNYTVEHIMPQNENLSPEWQKDLGENWKEIHEKYLHTLGNLTFTGYNPDLRDYPFITKRDAKLGGYRDTPIHLSADLRDLERWNEEEIIKRTKRLARRALEVWEYPNLPDEVLKQYMPKKEEAERSLEARHFARREFWKSLLEKSRNRTHLFANISPSVDNWICATAGRSGFSLCYGIYMDSAKVELHIDFDTETGTGNKLAFNLLFGQKEQVEQEFGSTLEWDAKEGRRSYMIRKSLLGRGLNDEDEWDSIQERMIDAMIRLDDVFRDRVAKLKP